jgi:hypothetical protein
VISSGIIEDTEAGYGSFVCGCLQLGVENKQVGLDVKGCNGVTGAYATHADHLLSTSTVLCHFNSGVVVFTSQYQHIFR